MGDILLILGGARSGKSDFAATLAGEMAGDRVLFVATAEALDEEMTARIEAHRRARPAAWGLLEAPRDTAAAIRETCADRAGEYDVVLVDCLTLLVTGAMLGEASHDNPAIEPAIDPHAAEEVDRQVTALLETCGDLDATSIIVTNEVGSGIVPDNALARAFRDRLGSANARVARAAKKAYLLVAGIAVDLKELSRAGGNANIAD